MRKLFENLIIKLYVHYGMIEGDSASYGSPSTVEGRFMFFEQQYAALGYIPIPHSEWVSIGGYGVPVEPYLRLKTQEQMQAACDNNFFDSRLTLVVTDEELLELYKRMISRVVYAAIAMNNAKIGEIIQDWQALFRSQEGEYSEAELCENYYKKFHSLKEKYK